jgi:hypothetical protein
VFSSGLFLSSRFARLYRVTSRGPDSARPFPKYSNS